MKITEKVYSLLRELYIINMFGMRGWKEYRKVLGNYGEEAKSELVKFKYDNQDLFIRSFSTDIMLMDSILGGKRVNRKWSGEYSWVEDYLMNLHKKRPIIIDAGANVGLFSRWVLKRVPEAQVYAIEVESGNFEILKRNTHRYSVCCINKGLWSKECHLKVIARDTGEWGFMVTETKEYDTDTVEAISLKDILINYKLDEIDLLKMDIEGSEYEIFSSQDLGWLDRCHALVVETHDHIVEGSDQLVNRVLKEHGFSKYTYEENQFFWKKKRSRHGGSNK